MKYLFPTVCFLLFFTTGTAQQVTTDNWTQLVPSIFIPKQIKTKNSNNNIDLVRYRDKYYMAFRTAPTHFASRKTHIYLMSSTDGKKWSYETEFFLATDMREPRFVVFNDTLRFYFFEAGTSMFRFETKHIWTAMLTADGWTTKVKTNLDGFVDWRFRVKEGKLYLSAYYGVNLYGNGHQANLRLFTSDDGIHFSAISAQPQITTKGAEEGEFIFDKHNELWATVRLEGSGAYLCHANKDSIDAWHRKFLRYKYDSALMFEQGDDLFLISRRHLKGFATTSEAPDKKERRSNLLRYSFSKKVTALFKVNKNKMELEHIMDFPSTGDTAFPAIARKDDSTFYLLNYSSAITKRSKIWISGQLGKTYIYQTQLHFQ